MELDMDFMESHDRDSIAAELRRIAALTGKKTVSMREIDRLGLLSSRSVTIKFGSLRQALEAAGLDASRLRRFTDDELSRMLADLWRNYPEGIGSKPLALRCPEIWAPFLIANDFGPLWILEEGSDSSEGGIAGENAFPNHGPPPTPDFPAHALPCI